MKPNLTTNDFTVGYGIDTVSYDSHKHSLVFIFVSFIFLYSPPTTT